CNTLSLFHFSLHCPSLPPHLHSFPTRRSSDLHLHAHDCCFSAAFRQPIDPRPQIYNSRQSAHDRGNVKMKRSVLASQKSRPGEFHQARGFSLIEMLIAVAIVTAVIAVVVQGITKMQRRSFVEGSKIDTVQETRDFIDQMVRDIHNVAYAQPKVNA